MRILQTPILQLTLRKTTSLLQREAMKNAEVANFLYSKNLRGNVSRQFVKTLLADTFDAKGHLTDKAQRQLKQALKILHLGEKTSVKNFATTLLGEFTPIKFSQQEIAELQKAL